MNDQTEGMLLALSCLTLGILTQLRAKDLFSYDDATEAFDRAEMTLAELSPLSSTLEARDFAHNILQKTLAGFRGFPAPN